MRILAIGAHPDDVEIGCGGLLLTTAKSGHEIYIYILTHGEASGDAGHNERERAECRQNEAIKSSEIIGARELTFGEFADTKLIPTGELVNSIEKVVRKVSPHLILSHSPRDVHHDHRAVGMTSLEAARYIPNVLTYENPLTIDFKPQTYFDITKEIENKIKLLSCFESQREKEYLKSRAIYGLAQYRALQSRLAEISFAEAFEVEKLKIFEKGRSVI